jgi:hypothetical protein
MTRVRHPSCLELARLTLLSEVTDLPAFAHRLDFRLAITHTHYASKR